jgi:hypothetical protein
VPAAQRTGEGNDRIVLDLSGASAMTQLSSVRLEAGDVVEVPRGADRVRRRITVHGNVWQPGAVNASANITLTEVRSVGGLKPDTYLRRVRSRACVPIPPANSCTPPWPMCRAPPPNRLCCVKTTR